MKGNKALEKNARVKSERLSRALFLACVVTAVAVAGFLHLWRLGSAPRGFSLDECAFAYNAYCIARTGADEYGTRWPMFFRSFDTYIDPVNVYSMAPFLARFGLEQWAARLPSALFALAAAVAFGCLVWECWRRRWLALAGGSLFSVLPWAFPISRDCSFAGHMAALLGLTAGIALTWRALKRQSYSCAMCSGPAWALALYAQQGLRPVVVLFLAGTAVLLWPVLRRRWRVCGVIAGVSAALVAPLAVAIARSPAELTARFQQVSLLQSPASPAPRAKEIVQRYAEYFGPRFLFVSGDPNLRHHTGVGGELYWCLLPLVMAGLYDMIRHLRRRPLCRLVLTGLLVAPLPAALTVDHWHSTRTVYGAVFWLLLAMMGARWLWQRRRFGRVVAVATCLTGALETGRYSFDYFHGHQARSYPWYDGGLSDALRYCFGHLSRDEVLYVGPATFLYYNFWVDGFRTDPEFRPYYYVQLLFHGRVDPRAYRQHRFFGDRVRLYDGTIASPGLLLRARDVLVPANDAEKLAAHTSSSRALVLVPNPEPLPAGARLIASFPFDRELWWDIYAVSRR